MTNYHDYLIAKQQTDKGSGFKPLEMPDYLFDFQRDLVEWSLKKGKAAIFADCGLGKSIMELVWAENVVQKTNKSVLLLTPIAVGQQMIDEAEKFGISGVARSRDGQIKSDIVVSNYQRLHYFDPKDFAGVILDESSILKNFNGKIKNAVNIFLRKVRYRLLATATPSPNDFIELGTSSEALGYLGYMDMLGRFFKNDQNNCATNRRGRFTEATKWRLKGHAHDSFWRWVSSWARAMRKPSDLGYCDKEFILPELQESPHKLDTAREPDEGMLFTLPAHGLKEVRDERRATVKERCEKAADLIADTKDYSVAWCNLNDEGNLLEKLIPDSIQVSGSDSDDAKERKLTSFTRGESRVLITKPKIGAWGLNWQHCNHMTYFPSYSYEQYYQAIRRCWRFGQTRPVNIDLIYTNGDVNSIASLRHKQKQADKMFTSLVKEMNNPLHLSHISQYPAETEDPKWA